MRRSERVVLIGPAPGRGADYQPRNALTGVAGTRIRILCGGLSWYQYGRLFERHNLLDRWPGEASGGGDEFPLPAACEGAMRLLPTLRDRRVVLLGRNVARAFDRVDRTGIYGVQTPPIFLLGDGEPDRTGDDFPGRGAFLSMGIALEEIDWFRRFTICTGGEGSCQGWVSPHPSGRSRYWNDPANVEAARAFWTTLASAAAGASPAP